MLDLEILEGTKHLYLHLYFQLTLVTQGLLIGSNPTWEHGAERYKDVMHGTQKHKSDCDYGDVRHHAIR